MFKRLRSTYKYVSNGASSIARRMRGAFGTRSRRSTRGNGGAGAGSGSPRNGGAGSRRNGSYRNSGAGSRRNSGSPRNGGANTGSYRNSYTEPDRGTRNESPERIYMPRNYTAQENKLFKQAKEMFGLNEKYTKIEVRKKYIELSKEFHPDKFHVKGKDIKKKEEYDKKLNEHTLKFQAVSKAQEILLERLQNPTIVQRPMNTSNIFSNIEKLDESNFVRPIPSKGSPRAKAGGGSPKGTPKGTPKGSKLDLSPRAVAAKQKLYSSKKNKDALRLLGFTEEEIEDRNHAGMSTITTTKILNKFIQNRTMTKEVEDAFKHLYKNGPASKPEESQSNPVVQREILGHINYRRGKFGGVKIENL